MPTTELGFASFQFHRLPSEHSHLCQAISHAAHYLPEQGPITSFVHHNTLHAFEAYSFDDGVKLGTSIYGCQGYLSEQQFRDKLSRGRIQARQLADVLLEDLGDEADQLVASFGTRFAIRLAMLQFPLHYGETNELRWVIAETEALRKFRSDVDPAVKEKMLSETRRKVNPLAVPMSVLPDSVARKGRHDDSPRTGAENDGTWEAYVLGCLWHACCDGVQLAESSLTSSTKAEASPHLRDLLLRAGGEDANALVHEVLIRYCAAFLDQGFAQWELPNRQAGLYQAFLLLQAKSLLAPGWQVAIRQESRRLLEEDIGPLQSIEESLKHLGIPPSEWDSFFTRTLLALRGWAGMIRQLETKARWVPYPIPNGSLVEFLAIRLLLDRLALSFVAKQALGWTGSLGQLRRELLVSRHGSSQERLNQRAFTIFQLAQARGWNPVDLQNLSREQWTTLVNEVVGFSSLHRRRIYQRAFERQYRNGTFDAVLAHTKRLREQDGHLQGPRSSGVPPIFQVITCIDDREESFRRHLEEIEPRCETFGTAGFFGVAMYFRGVEDAHFVPLAPASIVPRTYIREVPVYSAVDVEKKRARRRQRIGRATQRAHAGSRSLIGGLMAGLLGTLCAFLLIPRVFFPGLSSRFFRWLGQVVRSPDTELCLERPNHVLNGNDAVSGYDLTEMADIVEGVLRSIGLTRNMSPLVFVLGHGSKSQNNPHESAYNCGACSGNSGGPNARSFALMANDLRVRRILAERGLIIPESTHFVGGHHDTTSEAVSFSDLDRVPYLTRETLAHATAVVDLARGRNAHERCRRFQSVPTQLTTERALRAVESRAEDLSQTRPEYNHATNALCLVGRRDWHRGLFLDRRAFLSSYSPDNDDEFGTILESQLRAVIPVCTGINLEYYFSTVDPEGYGCGSKLPHNITSLLGVMAGAESDLRTGLSRQMVEIHEPMRLQIIVETTPEVMQRIIENNPAIERLVRGQWVHLAVFDPVTLQLRAFTNDGFVVYVSESLSLPVRSNSQEWYEGKREHLGFASITSPQFPESSQQ